MDSPDLYRKSSHLRADDHALLFAEYAPNFNWRVDGNDTVLDIGCAGGNVTCELILPKLPTNFSRLVAVDINEKMLEYATKNYKIPKVQFTKLDIGGDISEFKRRYSPFDHIISFFCFHLVPDQKAAMQNVYNLLGTNGDCFIHVLCDFIGFDVYRRMYKKWSEFMVDIDDYTSPYIHRVSPKGMLEKHLKNAGFKYYTVEERCKTVAYHDVDEFTGAYVPIFPFFSRIPLERQAEFLDEYVEISMEFKPDPGVKLENFKEGQSVNLFASYRTAIVYARK